VPPPAAARVLDPELVLTHDAFVRGLARRLLRDAHAAEDVAQQTWIAACLRPVAAASLRDWLGAVARRIAERRARAERRQLQRQQAAARPEQVPSAAAIVEREAMRAEVVRAVLHLQEPYRTVVLLRWFEGLPPRVIARRLRIPVETVRTRQKRALAELRARLDRASSRAAWCALLLPIADLDGRVALPGSVFRFLAGVMVMSVPVRLSIAAVLLAGVLAYVLWPPASATADQPGAPAAASEPASLQAGRDAAQPAAAAPPVEGGAQRTPAAGAAAATGSLLVRASLHDGTPAAGVYVDLLRSGIVDALARRFGVTDPRGEVRFADEAPGVVHAAVLRPETPNTTRCEITAGRETVVDLRVPRGIDVAGIVVDAGDAPVAGAEIVAAGWSGQGSYVLGRSGEDGRFALSSVSTHCHIGARTPAFCASSMHTITAAEDARVELRLVLSRPAATVEGLVFGPDGRPVAGALVRVGRDEQDNHRLADGTQAMAPRPAVVRTGPDGRFVATSLPHGKLPCAVRAPDLAPWQETIELGAGERREVTVRLQPAVTLAGVVRDEQGAPVPGAEVRVGEWRTLGHQRRCTDGSGAFCLTGLPVGEIKAHVDHAERGKAETTLLGRPGERLAWDPVLIAGLVLRGRVVDANDRPVAKVMLEARAEPGQRGGSWNGHGSSRADGSFELRGCQPGTRLQIDVRRHSMRELRLRDVVPGSDELVVRLPGVDWVRVKGVALGPEGKALANVVVRVQHPSGGGDMETLDPATGAFDVGPYLPGSLALRLETAGFAPILLHREVGPGEVWDAGKLEFARGGTVALRLVAEAGASVAEVNASVFDDRGSYVGFIQVKDGAGTGGPWAVGQYVLQFVGGTLAAARHPFSIRVGEVTTLDLQVARGVAIEILLELPPGLLPDTVPLELAGAGDEVVLRASAWRTAKGYVLRTALREGSYTVRVAEGPCAGQGRVEVQAPGPAGATLVLRPR
jgi:RNA polymerase sigma-70 factor (ECF subfamily)